MPVVIPAPDSTLEAIQIKVRRLTRSPSENQLSDEDLQNYINTFVVYDFPEHLRMFNLRTQFSFWCNPFQDVYPTDIASFGGATNANANSLYNFQNNYISVSDPLYIAGYQGFWSQSREQFYGIYPLTNSISSINFYGDGVTVSFSGVIVNQGSNAIFPTNNFQQTACFLKDNVLFSSVDINNNGLSLVDTPCLDATTGNPTVWGNLSAPTDIPSSPALITDYTTSPVPTGVMANNYINYVTGVFSITFPIAPAVGQIINSQTIPTIVSLPQALLYYDNQFILRPVPDQPYQVNFEAYVRPTYLMATSQTPMLEEWWQYISYGAAKKIFEDRLDMDSVALIMPEYKKQETLCLRRTIVQQTNQRAATIYTEQTAYGSGQGGWGAWGGPF